MDFGQVLTRAWQIIWRHKVLWIFGILASCGSAASSSGSNANTFVYSDNPPPDIQRFFDRIDPTTWAVIISGGVFLLLVLIVLAVFLSTVGKTGLILGTQRAESDSEGGTERLAFGELFKGSLAYFWRVLGLNLLIGLLIIGVVFGFTIFSFFGAVLTMGIALICILPLVCVLIPFLWFVGIVLEQGTIAIVADNLGVIDGLKKGWQVCTTNLGAIIVMSLILVVGISGIGGFILFLPFIIILTPFVIALMNDGPTAWQAGVLISGLCFVLYLPLLIVLSGVLRSYVSSAWTLTYLRLTRPTAAAPLEPVPSPA